MSRVSVNTEDVVMIIPTIGFAWTDRKVWLSFAWLNFGVSILLFERCGKPESEG